VPFVHFVPALSICVASQSGQRLLIYSQKDKETTKQQTGGKLRRTNKNGGSIMKNVNSIKAETLISLIVNIILGALIFAWACTNTSTAAATAIGIMVVVIGLVFSVSFPKLVSKN
jgi:1,4-dihydroxy-2-naphthoate octaprenyltransferase